MDGEVLGRVTSGGYGYSVERSIAYAYVPADAAEPGRRVEVEIFGEWVGGRDRRGAALGPGGRAHPCLSAAEVVEVADGLWIWRLPHPDWSPEARLGAAVTSTCVRSGGEVVLLDPLAPPQDDDPVWGRLDADPPTAVVVLKPDHVRDVDRFVERYGARAYGPELFFRHDVPEAELEPVQPGDELPGGLVALYDGRGRNETPVWLPEQRALVFADALTAPGGRLQVWATPWHEERALPALRALLELPFEHVIVSHGEPVHDRAAYEAALELPPYS